jgi:hypothetical protein
LEKTLKRHSPYSASFVKKRDHPDKRRKYKSSNGYDLTSITSLSQIHSSEILKQSSNSSPFYDEVNYNVDNQYRSAPAGTDHSCTSSVSSKDGLPDSTEEIESDDDSFVEFLNELFE